MFRPTNSSESNLFMIRCSIGYGSPAGLFGQTPLVLNNTILASNSAANITTINFLASPSANNLPSGFYIEYFNPGSYFRITYGKTFTSQPTINIIPATGEISSTVIIPLIIKTSLLYCDITFNNTAGFVSPSTTEANGLCGFDLTIIGPTKIGATTGNSNKGWALSDSTSSDPTSVYSYMDVNLGSGFTATDSVVISKNLKFIGDNNTIKLYTASTATLDYTQTVWMIGTGVNLTTLIPQKGMVLIIVGTNAATGPTVKLNTGCVFNYTSSNTLTFTNLAGSDSIILYGIDTTRFIFLSKSSGITLSTT